MTKSYTLHADTPDLRSPDYKDRVTFHTDYPAEQTRLARNLYRHMRKRGVHPIDARFAVIGVNVSSVLTTAITKEH